MIVHRSPTPAGYSSAVAYGKFEVERGLFSAISRNWAGEPLHSYEKILKFIRTTTTNTGLKVRAFLDRKDYPVGVKPSTARMREIHITRHNCAPRWNYTITPRM